MEKNEASARFRAADSLFREGRFEDALTEIGLLETAFPDNHRVLNAKARTLAGMRRYAEALDIYDRLLDEFEYEKVRSARNQVALMLNATADDALPSNGEHADNPSDDEIDRIDDGWRIPWLRLFILLALSAGMYLQYVPYWLGGGLIAVYFVVGFVIKMIIYRLFTLPFKMKAKALSCASVEFHGATPANESDAAYLNDLDWGEQSNDDTRALWLDVTVTPEERTEGFRHWEPGELCVAPVDTRIKSMDDLDRTYPVAKVVFVQDDVEEDDEGHKILGPMRMRCLVRVPETCDAVKFVYYTETFGSIPTRI